MKRYVKENRLFLICIVFAGIVIAVLNILAGKRSYGLEGDEVFSYISATSMGGFKNVCFLEDQTWYDADYFRDSLTAQGEERFNVKMVVENQAMDTHPPLFYLFLNFVCSLFPGRFSKWFGIGVNLVFLFAVGVGMYLLLRRFLDNRYTALFTAAVFCCSRLAVNMTLFIRMYALLMALTLFQSWYHLKLYDKVTAKGADCSWKKFRKEYMILAVITALGGLTHYYFLVMQCLFAAVYVFMLWLQKQYRDIFRYAAVMAVSGVACVCLYPAMLNHLFFKYRSREAVHKFLKETGLLEEFFSALSQMDEQLFKGLLYPVLFLLALGTAVMLWKKKIGLRDLLKGLVLAFPVFVYLYGISKASPFLSVRYICPAAALFYAEIIIWVKYLLDHTGVPPLQKWAPVLGCFALFFSTVYFLDIPLRDSYFRERQEIVERLAQEADYCVYITADGYNWKMWEDYVNYPQFKGLYFIDGRVKAPIEDEKLLGGGKLVVYVDKALDLKEMEAYLGSYLPVQSCQVEYETSYTYIVSVQEQRE